MDAAMFFLICFVLGFTLSLISFFSAVTHWHMPVKWPLTGGGASHGGVSAHVPGHFGGHPGMHGPSSISPVNSMTLTVFLAWFGGTGYLLTRYYGFWLLLALGISTVSGLVGAGIVLFFLVKVLMSHEQVLDPTDYELIGVVAKVSSPIRATGTGEIIFSQEGVRRNAGARSEDGTAIPKGAEVVVTRYDKGLAYVKLWDEWTN
jgi:hypothetical protein